ncbi:hypothetical protein SCOCK_100062 [Actinacidiphila cocklensis]|uniref:Uncharacterized protein n=1 Tax=Actinacidiphila cocklensis TaxID=887465 RepID=A0A9W4DN69_9ACTN|nr:hypothetical protein SCOCK_100062 [Actinacidiphila cocklensis]
MSSPTRHLHLPAHTGRRRTATFSATARHHHVNHFIASRVIDRSRPHHYGIR